MIYNDFLPPHRLPFHMAGYFLLGVELLKFDVVPFVYFFTLLPVLLVLYARNHCSIQCTKDFLLCFLAGV